MFKKLLVYASFVRLSHSVFALPFALVGAVFASRITPLTMQRVIWIVAAMVTARSAAMGFNRLVDAHHDALNPRTALRELPRGAMTKLEAVWFVVITSVAFIGITYKLGFLCFVLSPVALLIVFWYSLAKRYTCYAQLFLGLAMAVAPVGGWFAAGGRAGWEPWLLGLAIGAWVGGFDILYACQDTAFDKNHGLRSIPVRFGISVALWISRVMHVLSVGCLIVLGLILHLGFVYLGGVIIVGGLLIFEQSLVHKNDLSKIKRAFDLNGYVALLYLFVTIVAIYLE